MTRKNLPYPRHRVNPKTAHQAWALAARKLYPQFSLLRRNDYGLRLARIAEMMEWWRKRAERGAQ